MVEHEIFVEFRWIENSNIFEIVITFIEFENSYSFNMNFRRITHKKLTIKIRDFKIVYEIQVSYIVLEILI